MESELNIGIIALDRNHMYDAMMFLISSLDRHPGYYHWSKIIVDGKIHLSMYGFKEEIANYMYPDRISHISYIPVVCKKDLYGKRLDQIIVIGDENIISSKKELIEFAKSSLNSYIPEEYQILYLSQD